MFMNVMNVMKFGYRIEFIKHPESVFLSNNKSALQSAPFVEKAIIDLLNKKLVTECFEPPYYVNPLTVSAPLNKKPGLIINLRHVNACVVKRTLKFKGSLEGLNFAKKCGFVIKFDLTSGYRHINIHPDFVRYLYIGFSWNFIVQSVTLFFSVLEVIIGMICYAWMTALL